jgi:hypothetical protein
MLTMILEFADLELLAEAVKRDGEVWVLLRPSMVFEAPNGCGSGNANATQNGGKKQKIWRRGRNGHKEIERRLRVREAISWQLDELHADLLCR